MTTKLVIFHKQVPVNSVFAFTDSITFLQMCLALQFADDADLTGGSNGELKDLINRLIDNAMTWMEVSTEKSKIITNSTNNINADISMNCQRLEEVTSFKYLGATLCKDGTYCAEVCIRITSAMAAMARLNKIWHCHTLRFASRFKLYKFPIISILLYGCETWTLLADSERGIYSRLSTPSAWGNFSASPTWSTRPMTGCGAWSTSLWVHRNLFWWLSSGDCQEMETCIVWACHMPWQPLQNHPSGHLGWWAMHWSEEEMLDGQHQRVVIPAHAWTVHKGLLQKRLEEDLCWLSLMFPQWHNRSRDKTESPCITSALIQNGRCLMKPDKSNGIKSQCV